MSEFNLKLVANNAPGSLEQILESTVSQGFNITRFDAELKGERDQYEVTLRLQGSQPKESLILALAGSSSIRELMPCRR
ncbi:hypothetical protein ACWJJH_15915 [Endozoicomonadaceae bacterium StTr2]